MGVGKWAGVTGVWSVIEGRERGGNGRERSGKGEGKGSGWWRREIGEGKKEEEELKELIGSRKG